MKRNVGAYAYEYAYYILMNESMLCKYKCRCGGQSQTRLIISKQN